MMAVVSHAPAITQRVDSLRVHDIRVSGIMASRQEIAEEPVARIIDDLIHVAVGKDVKEGKSIVEWAYRYSGGKKLCIIHVHQPAQKIPLSKFTTRTHIYVHSIHTYMYVCISTHTYACVVAF
jgi:hypothetical protein